MRNMLAFLAALFLIFAGLGAWRGWYGVESQKADTGKFAFRVEVNGLKVLDDVVQAARAVGRKLSEKQEEKAAGEKQEQKSEE